MISMTYGYRGLQSDPSLRMTLICGSLKSETTCRYRSDPRGVALHRSRRRGVDTPLERGLGVTAYLSRSELEHAKREAAS